MAATERGVPDFRSVVGEHERDRVMDETIRTILAPVGKFHPWESYQRKPHINRAQGNSKYVAIRSVSTDPEKAQRVHLPSLHHDMSLRVSTSGNPTPRMTLMANKMEQIRVGNEPLRSSEELCHFHRFNKSMTCLQLRRDLPKAPTVHMEYILNSKPLPPSLEIAKPAFDFAVNVFKRSGTLGRLRGSANSLASNSSSTASPVITQGKSSGIVHVPSSGTSAEAVFRRISSTMRRVPSSGSIRRAYAHQHPIMQGREYVIALVSRRPNLPPRRSELLDRTGQSKSEAITKFCDHVSGSSDHKFITKCQDLLTLMPDDRSFSDLSVLLDLVGRVPLLDACTAVEKFAIARTCRLQRYKATQTVSNGGDSSRLLVVLSGFMRQQGIHGSHDLPSFSPLDPKDVLPHLCRKIKDLGAMGTDISGWPSAMGNRQMSKTGSSLLPSIQSRPGTIAEVGADAYPSFDGGNFVAESDASCFEVDVQEFNSCLDQYAAVDKERESNGGYIASFLASLEMFSSWPWVEVLGLSRQVKSIQVDKGLCLLRQGDRLDALHILHRGEAQVELDGVCSSRTWSESDAKGASSAHVSAGGASKANSMHRSEDPRSTAAAAGGQLAYGVSVDVMADAEGLPKAHVSKKRHAKSLGLTTCGPRSIFGEELALTWVKSGASHTAPHNKGLENAGSTKNRLAQEQAASIRMPHINVQDGFQGAKKGDDTTAPRSTYSLRMRCSSEVYSVSRHVLEDFFSAGSRRRLEMRKEFVDKLVALHASRTSCLSPMVQKITQTQHEINRIISPTKMVQS